MNKGIESEWGYKRKMKTKIQRRKKILKILISVKEERNIKDRKI